ncbi:hypothetical protein COO60DRAFT_105705 [Scenedesmus sp. NREL 46B-D3]|nr:hypothetical protein COO60DRAFT_105705 [Scenedesmus sp. NREL 46B-D3]
MLRCLSVHVPCSVPVPGPVWSVAWSPLYEHQLLMGLDKGRLAVADLRKSGRDTLLYVSGSSSGEGVGTQQPLHSLTALHSWQLDGLLQARQGGAASSKWQDARPEAIVACAGEQLGSAGGCACAASRLRAAGRVCAHACSSWAGSSTYPCLAGWLAAWRFGWVAVPSCACVQAVCCCPCAAIVRVWLSRAALSPSLARAAWSAARWRLQLGQGVPWQLLQPAAAQQLARGHLRKRRTGTRWQRTRSILQVPPKQQQQRARG